MARRIPTPKLDLDDHEIERRWRRLARAEWVDPRLHALGDVVDPGAAALVKAVRERAAALEAGGAPLASRLGALESFLLELGVMAAAEEYLGSRSA